MKVFYRLFFIGFWILFLTVSTVASQEVIPQKAREIISKKVDNGPLVGVAVGYISQEGETLFYTKGTLSQQENRAVDKNTIFEIGSVTKVFSALAISKLVKEKGISLDTNAEDLLSEEFDLPEYEGQSVTLKHLLTHTAGLPRIPGNLSVDDISNPYKNYTESKLKAFLAEYELPRKPGVQFEYSNLGMAIVGYILEHQYDTSYEQVIKKQILKPLGMSSTGVEINSGTHSVARGHRAGSEVPRWDFASIKAAGALASNAADMTSFLKAQLGYVDTDLKPAIQKSQETLFDIRDEQGKIRDMTGMAWMISTQADTILWHNGGTGGFHSFVGMNLEKQTGVVMLSNTNESIDDIGFHILDQDHQLENFVSLSTDQLKKYVGEYQVGNGGASFFVTQNNNQLYIRLTGQNKLPVYPKSKDIFIYKAVNAKVQFFMNDGKHPNRLTLFQNGREITAEKVKSKIR